MTIDLLSKVGYVLGKVGIEAAWAVKLTTFVVFAVAIVIVAVAVYLLTTKVVGKIIIKLTRKTQTNLDDMLFQPVIFRRLGMLLASIAVVVVFSEYNYVPEPNAIILKLLHSWIVFASVRLVAAVLEGVNRVYETFPMSKDRPIRMFIQLLMIFFWCAAAIVIVSIFTGKNPMALLGGLAALTAVLMLIFQDTILGFVAGIQLSSNHMLRIGDWIEMPSRGVDGDVIEIGLTTVKVQNWDRTISTIPTHKLVSESFTNWRGMEESRGRRIKRSVNIDVNSIRYLTDEDLEELKKSALLHDYIEGKIRELNEYNANRGANIDKRRLTNVGTFREYLEEWIERNPDINLEMTHMVRQLQPGPTGLPLEVYCFSARQAWVDYEQVQADMFDHIYAVLPMFWLHPFQYGGSTVEVKR